jgi:hypothetical protein
LGIVDAMMPAACDTCRGTAEQAPDYHDVLNACVFLVKTMSLAAHFGGPCDTIGVQGENRAKGFRHHAHIGKAHVPYHLQQVAKTHGKTY